MLAAAVVAVALVVAAVVLFSGGGSGGSGGGTPSPPRLTLAVNAGPMFFDPGFSPDERDQTLALAARAGVTDVRADGLWEVTEPTPPSGGRHSYDWGYADEVAGRLARHGMRWWVVLDYAAGWATRDPRTLHVAPRDPRTFAEWSAAFARRYGPGGDFWRAHPDLPARPVRTYEVWNEPNSAVFWRPRPDPEAYAALFDATQAAVRRVQPDARMITGGLAPSDDFVRRMVAARPSLRRTITAVGFHPYGRTPAVVRAKVRTARAQLDAAGLSAVPLSLTEFGWALQPPDDPLYVSQDTRARYLVQAARSVATRGCDVDALVVYAWVSSEFNLAHKDDWLGLAKRPAQPTASTDAWARLQHDPPAIARGPC